MDDPTAATIYMYPETVLDSFFGIPHLTPNGSMTVDQIDEETMLRNLTNSSLQDVGYARVIGSINKTKLKQVLFELLWNIEAHGCLEAPLGIKLGFVFERKRK